MAEEKEKARESESSDMTTPFSIPTLEILTAPEPEQPQEHAAGRRSIGSVASLKEDSAGPYSDTNSEESSSRKQSKREEKGVPEQKKQGKRKGARRRRINNERRSRSRSNSPAPRDYIYSSKPIQLKYSRNEIRRLRDAKLVNMVASAAKTAEWGDDALRILQQLASKVSGSELLDFYDALGDMLMGGSSTADFSRGKPSSSSRSRPQEDLKSKILYDIRDFKIMSTLGQGNFAITYKVREIKQGITLALKKPKVSMSIEDAKEEMLTLMQVGKHRNVVSFQGLVTYEGTPSFLLEFCHHGNVSGLHNIMDLTSAPTFSRIVRDIARGLSYLHSRSIVHRDIACRNLLMKKDGTIVVSDYGLSRKMDTQKETLDGRGSNRDSEPILSPRPMPSPRTPMLHRWSTFFVDASGARLPWAWTAPEAFFSKRFEAKSDMYSVGVTLWEILTKGKRPYAGTMRLGQSPKDTLKEIMDGKITLEIPDGVPTFARKLTQACLRVDPLRRPSAFGLLLAAPGGLKEHLGLNSVGEDEMKGKKAMDVNSRTSKPKSRETIADAKCNGARNRCSSTNSTDFSTLLLDYDGFGGLAEEAGGIEVLLAGMGGLHELIELAGGIKAVLKEPEIINAAGGVETILKAYGSYDKLVMHLNEEDEEPVEWAAQFSQPLFSWLLRKGELDLEIAYGHNRVSRAASMGHWEAVKHLLEIEYEVGLDMEGRDSVREGGRATKVSRSKDESKRSRHGKTEPGIIWAARNKYDHIVHWLLQGSIGDETMVGHTDLQGRTPLMLVCARDNNDDGATVELADWLIGNCADVEARDRKGMNALLWAALNGTPEVALWLCEKAGADPTAADDDGRTALHWAVRRGKSDMAKQLVGVMNSSLTALRALGLQDDNGETPLELANSMGMKELHEWLENKVHAARAAMLAEGVSEREIYDDF